jgi:hypothetical protein
MAIGYEFLRETLGLLAFAPRRVARIAPVTRVRLMGDDLAIPARVAPNTDAPLAHLLFALKHEGTNLQILMEALKHIPGADLLAEIQRTPTGGYARVACFLWEHANGKTLEDAPTGTGVPTPVFDPERYITGPVRNDARWRVQWNGLGTLQYCMTVERTDAIQAAIGADILGRANHYARSLEGGILDRALAWAYLSETKDSYAIEREVPSEEKQRAFVAVLHQAHERRELTEDYLCDLQRATVTNPFDQAMAFRDRQNYLQGPLRGASGITYVPPPPDVCRELMTELMDFANSGAAYIDPVVAASVISFGFVYLHPFFDGNGRLSRWTYHYALCRSGQLENGLILPVSIAMKKHETEYLAALQSFSKPARERWGVTYLDEGQYTFQYRGDPGYGIYRYWDATPCVEFGYRMAEQALDVHLRQETEYLQRYDSITRAVNSRFDVRGSDLATLVMSSLDHDGVISKRRRDQFADRVPAPVFDFIEETTRHVLNEQGGEEVEDPQN